MISSLPRPPSWYGSPPPPHPRWDEPSIKDKMDSESFMSQSYNHHNNKNRSSPNSSYNSGSPNSNFNGSSPNNNYNSNSPNNTYNSNTNNQVPYDKTLTIRTPSLSTSSSSSSSSEMDRSADDVLKPYLGMLNVDSDYYHQLYKKALKCIDKEPLPLPPPPITSRPPAVPPTVTSHPPPPPPPPSVKSPTYICPPSPVEMRSPPRPAALPPLPPPGAGYESVGRKGYDVGPRDYPYMEMGDGEMMGCRGGCWMSENGQPCEGCRMQKMGPPPHHMHGQRDMMMSEKGNLFIFYCFSLFFSVFLFLILIIQILIFHFKISAKLTTLHCDRVLSSSLRQRNALIKSFV